MLFYHFIYQQLFFYSLLRFVPSVPLGSFLFKKVYALRCAAL